MAIQCCFLNSHSKHSVIFFNSVCQAILLLFLVLARNLLVWEKIYVSSFKELCFIPG